MTMTTGRAAVGVAVAVALLVLAVPFFTATTFIGDDHLFLAFARHETNPLAAFVSDKHGGEYYRPLPMLLWWCLGRLAPGAVWPFALLALVLHLGNAALVAALLDALGRPERVAWSAGALFAVLPQNLETAYWFSASTDLLATAFVLGCLVSLLRRRTALAAALALAAYVAKESSFVLPALALIVLVVEAARKDATGARGGWLLPVLPLSALLAIVLAFRTHVLHGAGTTDQAHAGVGGLALQIGSGLAHALTGNDTIPEPLATAMGAATWALLALGLSRQRRGWTRFAPLAFAGVAAAPVAATGWAVGARYFYLPAVGLCWALGEVLGALGAAAELTGVAILLLVVSAAAAGRRREVLSYGRRVAAARRAVGAGIRAGHRVFHVDGGIKDLDLAIKEEATLAAASPLILTDVPASFAAIPSDLAARAALVVAQPPLPPSGAYEFGDVRIVGLARRGDDPDLQEVLAAFPDLRFIRLRAVSGGQVVGRDLTREIERRLDATPAAEQE
jgi:hypothetical protein